MTTTLAGLAAIAVLMALEQRWSSANEQRLRAAGAIEPAGDVYRAMAVAYPGSFLAMAVEGWWRGHLASRWLTAGLLVFVAAKVLKYWAVSTLGRRWTFRVLVPPGEPLVAGGPYRWVRHPNYVAVAGELVGAWCWFGAWFSGPVCTVSFMVLMCMRVRVEDRALGRQLERSSREPQ